MNYKETVLVLKDLSARLPYHLKAYHYKGAVIEIDSIASDGTVSYYRDPLQFKGELLDLLNNKQHCPLEGIKPYLRPMSSMTEEEKRICKNRWCYEDWDDVYDFLNNYKINTDDVFDFVDWLNAHHFDYRGLIEKGLALEAPKDMYNV